MRKARNAWAARTARLTSTGLALALTWPAQAAQAEPADQSAATEAPARQAGDPGNGDIVVTATRQDRLLSRVPISVAAYSKETMDRLGVRNVEDIALLTPGVTFSKDSFGGGTGSNISIRGIRSTGGAATTGIYIDDVAIQIRNNPQTSFGSLFPKVFDLDRIEVLRGPQGTLFGAGAQGGVVRFITPTPSLTKTSAYARSEVGFTAGGAPSYEAGLAAGAPLVTDRIGLRVSGYFRRDGGYVDRRPQNRATPNSTEFCKNTNAVRTLALRGALAFQLSDAVTVTPALYYQRVESDDTPTFWDYLSTPGGGKLVNGSVLAQPSRDRFLLPSLNITADLGGATFTSVTSYFDRKGRARQDYTNLQNAYVLRAPVPFVAGYNAPGDLTAAQKVFSQEVRLGSGSGDRRFTWTIGAYYSRAKQSETFAVEDLYIGKIIPIERIFGEGLTDGKYFFLASTDSTDKQWAAFAQAEYKITPALSVSFGARYSKVELAYARGLGGPVNYTGSGPDFKINTGSQQAKPFTPKIGLNYTVDDNNLLYASAAKGFRGGGVNPPVFASCSTRNIPQTYGPDTTWSYEVGSKNKLFGGAVRLEASAFYVKWNDVQFFISAGCAGNGYTANVGSARSQGFDLQFSIKPAPTIQLSGSIGYVDATYRQTVTINKVLIARKGDALQSTPWQLVGMVDITPPISPTADAYFHGDISYNSRNKGRSAARDTPGAAGYDPTLVFDPAITEVNLRAGVRSGGLDASVFVSNFFDAAPTLGKYHNTPSSPLYYYNTIRPRTIGLTVGYRY